jgi:ectoine hydroxylase-related dioxygenase (phytanoyl-CoA dioxygenase family)
VCCDKYTEDKIYHNLANSVVVKRRDTSLVCTLKTIGMKKTTLPSLHETVAIDAAQVKDFREKGHTLTRGILQPEEVTVYRDVINEAAYKYNTETRKLADRDTYGKAFLQIMNLWEQDEAVRQFTLAKRFAKIAADLLGVQNVRIYHDQALYKEPGGGFTPWHQDQYYWPLNTHNTVTMWMPLIAITEEMGMLTFASGSHTEGSVRNIAISDESEEALNNYIQKKGYDITRATTMNAGDATWHYGWTLHAAPGNNSGITREVMTIIYLADGAEVTTPINEHQETDRNRWLQGLQPGEAAASKLNPLVL